MKKKKIIIITIIKIKIKKLRADKITIWYDPDEYYIYI